MVVRLQYRDAEGQHWYNKSTGVILFRESNYCYVSDNNITQVGFYSGPFWKNDDNQLWRIHPLDIGVVNGIHC